MSGVDEVVDRVVDCWASVWSPRVVAYRATQRLAAEPVDVVITDWNMPGMNGIEFVRAVRSVDATKTIPVLMVTTNAGRGDIIEALQAGVNDYVIKPFTADTIRDKIRGVLEK